MLAKKLLLIDEDGMTGATDPYGILGIAPDVAQQAVRKAYKKLTVAFHPDKNPQELKEQAQRVFLEVVAAWNILGTPDKRAAFDDFGRDGEGDSFNSFWEYAQSGQTMDEDFYQRNPYITRTALFCIAIRPFQPHFLLLGGGGGGCV